MPANIVYEPADRPAVEVLRDGGWLTGELHGWTTRDGEQWAWVVWTKGGETYRATVPEADVRKPRLTELHRQMLDFETRNQHWTHGGTKETAVLNQFGISLVRYYSTLNWIIEQPDALQHAPATVRRLERLRDARREARGLSRGE